MSAILLRPTPPGGNKRERPWKLYGLWGERELPPMSKSDLRDQLHGELVRDGLMPPDALLPSNKHHYQLTELLRRCSWRNGHWVADEAPALISGALRANRSL
jgi:hypothetical protein